MENSHTIFLMTVILFSIQLQILIEATYYDDCRRSFQCGNVNVTYPFYDGEIRPAHCGYCGFEIKCNREMAEISITTTMHTYYLLWMDSNSQTISVAPEDYYNGYCPEELYNTTLNFSLFNYTPTVENVTLYYDCPNPAQPQVPNQFVCSNISNDLPVGYFMTSSMQSLANYFNITPGLCQNNIVVPVNQSVAASISDINTLQAAFRNGFELNWIADNKSCNDCRRIGGECGYDTDLERFACYCPDEVHDPMCHVKESHRKKLKITLTAIAVSVVGSALVAVALLFFTKKLGSQNLNILSKTEREDSKDVEAVLKRFGEHALKRYTYGEIKQLTSYFKEKLGEGGYGSVYKGKLPADGSPVAVKLLKNRNYGGTEFTNEVSSISETNHVNVVTLLGYCFQGRKRALVYEFMSNGSLDRYIYSGETQNPLAWETLHQIAIGIGRGLEYLHQGCRTRILHFDIKPHNILLDAKFCPKISDFGLAKPWLQTKSLMTMSGARGTPGYIAPEVFCRGFGGASHKSDVYSYGMLILDLVGCKNNNIAGSERTGSELYFPHWIYKQFELKEDHELLELSNEEEKVLQKKMVIVSLWCIQMNPSSRPSISRAVEMLEEDLESLQVPPMPTLSSPPKPHPQTSFTNTMSL